MVGHSPRRIRVDPLVLPNLATLESVEESLQLVADSGGAPLQLSKDFVSRRKGALHDAARLQLLVTWARRAQDRYLHFHAANAPDTVLAELCDYSSGIAALRLSDGVKVGDHSIGRREALAGAASKLLQTDQGLWRQIVRGRTIDFICVSGDKLQYLRPLFTVRNKLAVKRKDGMLQTLTSLSSFIAQGDADLVPPTFIRACAVFACELLKNTQEHATSDHKNQPYVEHVEGLILSGQQMDEDSYGADFEGHPRLREFWQRERVPVRDGRGMAVRCLQLSFFDSGPGFASRATGKLVEEISPEDERNALFDSLRKNASSKREPGAGNGLPDVLEALREAGGLISIRTGRLHVFNAFTPGEVRDPFNFADWSAAPLASVVGAVVSLLIPIRR